MYIQRLKNELDIWLYTYIWNSFVVKKNKKGKKKYKKYVNDD